jgi:hypothetical protein
LRAHGDTPGLRLREPVHGPEATSRWSAEGVVDLEYRPPGGGVERMGRRLHGVA